MPQVGPDTACLLVDSSVVPLAAMGLVKPARAVASRVGGANGKHSRSQSMGCDSVRPRSCTLVIYGQSSRLDKVLCSQVRSGTRVRVTISAQHILLSNVEMTLTPILALILTLTLNPDPRGGSWRRWMQSRR